MLVCLQTFMPTCQPEILLWGRLVQDALWSPRKESCDTDPEGPREQVTWNKKEIYRGRKAGTTVGSPQPRQSVQGLGEMYPTHMHLQGTCSQHSAFEEGLASEAGGRSTVSFSGSLRTTVWPGPVAHPGPPCPHLFSAHLLGSQHLSSHYVRPFPGGRGSLSTFPASSTCSNSDPGLTP